MSTPALARTLLAPLLLGLAAVLLWQVGVTALDVKPFVLPSPVAIGTEFGANLASVVSGSVVTGRNALVGLVAGAVLAVLVAGLSALARVFDGLVAPIVAAAAVVPIVALAPVLYTMFGANVETARQLVAALAVFVPVYINTLRGLRQALPVRRDLMRAYAASPWQTARTITLPGAVPFFYGTAHRLLPRRDLGSGRRILRRAGRRARQVDHHGGIGQRLRARLRLRARRRARRPPLLLRHRRPRGRRAPTQSRALILGRELLSHPHDPLHCTAAPQHRPFAGTSCTTPHQEEQ
ncbi:ABC transporter permease subunit [Rathayibacter oskolensis]|nr:ABC transporter permease subunit [Rathayibacter oskolensis]WKK71542.1 ABC transporter permease subunit [Rathayibacter oskolensis]